MPSSSRARTTIFAMSMLAASNMSVAILLAAPKLAELQAGQGALRGQPPRQEPLPAGQRIDARDGDVVVVEGNARVRIVRRRTGVVRVIFNAADKWLVVLIDHTGRRGGAPDGGVDASFTFNGLSGDWPLPERWQGEAVVEEYSSIDQGPPRNGIGLNIGQGLLQVLASRPEPLFQDPTAVAVFSYRSLGSGGGGGMPFDEVERQQVAVAIRNAQTQARMPGDVSIGVGIDAAPGVVAVGPTYSGRPAPVRVGGNIGPPRKIYDVPAEYPDAARQSGIQGVVILEVTIGTDGTVADARVLRSVPLLDAAAIDAVRKWRYEPVLLNGNPVPVVMTVTVSFNLQL